MGFRPQVFEGVLGLVKLPRRVRSDPSNAACEESLTEQAESEGRKGTQVEQC